MTTTEAAPPLFLELLVSDLSPHPANGRTMLGDIAELSASIAQRGVLEPLIVCTADAFIATNPDLAEGFEIRDWVVLAGHRRLAAAQQAKRRTVPAIVRDDLAGETDFVVTMVVENLQREKLTPLDEARAFGRLRDAKWSERKIAKTTGISHSQVHKRLSLLRLPHDIQTVLTPAGDLTVADALKLLELPDDEIPSTWKAYQDSKWRRLSDVVDGRLRFLEDQARREALRVQLAQAGVEVVDDIREVLGPDCFDHTYPDGTTLEQITNPTDTIAVVSRQGFGVRFYSRTIPLDTADNSNEDQADEEGASGGSTQTSERSDEELEADRLAGEAAAACRAEACEWLVHCEDDGKPPVELFAEILADFVLTPTAFENWGAATLAAKWFGTPLFPDDADISYNDQAIAEEQWIAKQSAAGGETQLRAAVALALADLEKNMPSARGYRGELAAWSPREIRHVQRLVEEKAHELSEVEQRIIAHSEAKHATEQEGTEA